MSAYRRSHANQRAHRNGGRRGGDAGLDRGSVTVEAAVALGVLVLVLAGALAGIACLVAQLRCVDAAGEAARLAGRGDDAGAHLAVDRLAPSGAGLALTVAGDQVSAAVTVDALGGVLPKIRLRATATAAREGSEPPDRLGGPH